MSKSISLFTFVSILAILLFHVKTPANAKTAKCLLVVDGKTYINGYCSFEFENGDGSFSFSDEKMLQRCGGPGVECSGASTKILRNGTFGGLNIQNKNVGRFWWNSGFLRKGGSLMDQPLYRSGACWENTRVKLCAW